MTDSPTSKQCAHVPLFAAGAGQIAREVTPCPRCEIDRLRRFAWWVECGDFENTTDLQRRAHEVLGGSPVETACRISKAHAKRILQDWIEDDAHAESLRHWPDLRAAYEALHAIAESSSVELTHCIPLNGSDKP